MSSSTTNIAFIGCGGITRSHSRTLRRFGRRVRCLYASRDPAKAAALNQKYNGAGYFDSYGAALTNEGVDAVLVATPPNSHLEHTLAALDHGKHVIVEKPAFLKASDVDIVRAAEVRSRCRVLVAENYCYKPVVRTLRDIVRSGVLGEIRFLDVNAVKYQASADWRSNAAVAGGGALFEGGVHWIDFLDNIGPRIEAVHGFRPGEWRAQERSMLVVAEYEDGSVGTLTHSWEIPSALKGIRLSHIYGTRASVTFESNGLIVVVTGARPRVIVPGLRDIGGYHAMFHDFLQCLQTGSQPVMTLGRAQRGLELIESAYRNVTTHPELETIT